MYVAFVLLPEATRPDPEAIAAVYSELFPGRPPLVATSERAASGPADDAADADDRGNASTDASTGANTDTDADAISLASDEGIAHVMLMPIPVPDGEAERNAERSLAFVGQEPELPPHSAHLVVPWSPSENQTILEGLQAQARVTAAVTLASGGVAVYMGAAGATHPAEWFVEVARQVDDPIMLWIGVSHAVTEEARHSFLSFGMHQFGQPDLLLTAPLEQGSDAIEYFYDLLAYCASTGRAVNDGETVGRTDDERILVRYEPNPVDEDRVVFCVDL